MLSCVRHRGPDDESRYEKDNFSVGMRRLAIIDLSTNIYPVANETGDILCLFNGEIYNYITLRADLKTKGHTFKTNSDSEVIVHAYEEWGEKFVDYLRGMFAIALYDGKQDQLLLIRDRMGIKPLYYAEHDGRVVFASEIKALFAAWDIDRSPDDNSVFKFLISRVHDDTKRTFFKHVKRLLPAHLMVIDNQGNYRLERYWQPTANSQFKSDKADTYYSGALREKLLESMKLHLITDVPLGVNLSGGLDSSAVVSMAAKLMSEGSDLHTDKKLLTFSAIHPGESIDETEYIDEVIKFTNAESIRIEPKLEEFWNELDTWVYFQEEPTISTAPYAYYVVMRKAHERVKVLLSGQGGDELFAGYIPYFMSYIQTARDANAYLDILRESVQGFDLYRDFFRQKLSAILNKNSQLQVTELINQQELAGLENTEEVAHKHLRNLNERLMFDITEGSVPNLLRYEDKNAMAHSIESRVPFLDHEVVELALSIPADQKIKHGWNRYVYREAMKGLMPEKNRLRRSKIGFVNSEWEWLKAKRDSILAIFRSPEFRSRKYWQADKVVAQFVAWCENKREGDGLMFWRILSTELWLRRYVDNFQVI